MNKSYEQWARHWTAWVTERPALARGLRVTNTVLTDIGYVAYPLLLVLLWFFAPYLLVRCIVVPAVGFAVCTAVRSIANMPRPYEVFDIKPIVDKDTKGKSFPSRHTFCMFTIALSWFVWLPNVGAMLLVLACLLATIRVYAVVHFPRDVLAGAILAVVICVLGYYCIPW